LPQYGVDFIQLLIIQTPGAARTFSFYQTSQAFLFETANPVFHGSRRVPQEAADLRAAHPLGDQQYPMQAVVISGIFGSPDFILQSKNNGRRIGYS
jgi:hypothetical protein